MFRMVVRIAIWTHCICGIVAFSENPVFMGRMSDLLRFVGAQKLHFKVIIISFYGWIFDFARKCYYRVFYME